MDARLPDAFCESVVSLLPTQEPPGRRGGRPAIPHAVVLKVIWFVLTVGCRWKDIPRELGCCGETARQRLKLWQELGVCATSINGVCVACRYRAAVSTLHPSPKRPPKKVQSMSCHPDWLLSESSP